MISTGFHKSFRLLLFFTGSMLLVLISRNNFFFWDTITQVSVPANWYYDQNFRYLYVPNGTATEHPTVTGMYLAVVWKLFGRSLMISHLAFLPFIFGIFLQLFTFIEKSGEKASILWLIFMIVLCDPTLISQMSLMTFDIIQIFAYLWCLNSIIENKDKQLSVAFTLLCLSSLRGIVCGGGILIYAFIHGIRNSNKISVRMLITFLPGIVITILYYFAFYLSRGSVTQALTPNKWIQFSEFASLSEMIRNVGIFGWRLIDFGRVGIWIVFAVILLRSSGTKKLSGKFEEEVIIVALTQFIVFFPSCILYRNPFGHRYLLPVLIPAAIFTVYYVLKYLKNRWIIYSFMFVLLLSGWFWVYPVKISLGWDSTPAHWPYYKIRSEMIGFIEAEKIPFESVGSFFPNTASFRLIDLSDDHASFKSADIDSDDYILFSNVYNLKDPLIDELFSGNKWCQVKSITRKNVSMILFKRNS